VRKVCSQRSARQSSPAFYRAGEYDASAQIRFEDFGLERSGRSGINRLDAGRGQEDDRENGGPDDRVFQGSWSASYLNAGMHSRNPSARNSTFVFRDQHHQRCDKSRKDAQPDPAATSSDSMQQEEDEAHARS
jgi:hypothetical protein